MKTFQVMCCAMTLAVGLTISSTANASSIDFDCDTVPDHFSTVSQKVDGHALTLSGSLRVVQKRSGRYLPLAGVLLSPVDTALGRDFIGFPIVASKDDAATSEVTFRDHSSANSIKALNRYPDAGDKSFSLSLSDSGVLTLTLGADVFTMNAPRSAKWPRVRVDIMCSTGQFKFFNTTLALSG